MIVLAEKPLKTKFFDSFNTDSTSIGPLFANKSSLPFIHCHVESGESTAISIPFQSGSVKYMASDIPWLLIP